MPTVNSPNIPRNIQLALQGDWGMANLHRICGWLSQEMGDRTGPGSRFVIWNGHGGFDAARALGRGEVDVALSTPALFAKMAVEGRGPFAGHAVGNLRALAVIPQWDRLVLAIDAQLGIRSFSDLRRMKPALTIAVSCDDGRNHIGYATRRLMEIAGIDDSALQRWGGGYLERQRPDECIALARAGQCTAVFQEAIMTAYWRDLMTSRPMNLIPMESAVLKEASQRYGWLPAQLPKGYFPGLEEPIAALDYSDFLVMVRDDMPEDIAHLLTWCLIETRAGFERQYHHLPRERSPVSYPLEPRCMARTPIGLHRGAAKYYREAGYL